MIRPMVRSAIGIMAMILPGLPARAGDIFLSPRLEARTGHEKNRMAEAGNGEGSAFWQASPGLDVILFGAMTETSLLLDYRRTQYSEGEFEARDEASVFARWRYLGGQNEAGASVGGGLYRDQALPDDDYTFWQARPFFVRTLEGPPVELSVKSTFRQKLYDVSVYTSATDRADSRMELRPGFRWHLSHRATVWGEVYAEQNVSDAAEAEYSGFGGAMGCEFRPAARLNMGAWAGIGVRPYAEKVNGETRRDKPMPAGVWATYRLSPWMELFSAVDWESYGSTIEDDDYSWWRVGGGLKLVFEHELGGQ